MKRYTVLEASIIGLLIGVVVSAYVVFLDSSAGYMGNVMNWISMKPLFLGLNVPMDVRLIAEFIFIVAVFVVYGCIAGIIIKKGPKAFIAVTVLLLLALAAGIYDQGFNSSRLSLNGSSQYANVITMSPTRAQQQPQQYFGMEARGDLNGDDASDIAFVMSRKDADRGVLYYLSAALATTSGHFGTNIVFLGDQHEPTGISIASSTISIDYIDHNDNSTSTLYAFLGDDQLILDKASKAVVK